MMTVRPRTGPLLAVLALFLLMLAVPSAAAAPRRGMILAGTVRGPTGATVALAEVTAYAQPGAIAGCAENPEAWSAVARTTTSRAGGFSFTLPPGSYRLGVVPPDRSAMSFGFRVGAEGTDGSNVTSWVGFADDVLLPTNGLSGVDVRLSTPRAVTGTVVEETTAVPLSGIEVRAVSATGSQTQRISPMTTTTADGSYSLGGLPVVTPDPNPATPENEAARYGMTYVDPMGTHQIWLWWWTGFGPPSLPNDTPVVDVTTEADPVRDVIIRPTGQVTGTVTDAKGRPLAGIAVEPWMAFPYPARYTDAKGRYSVEDSAALRFSDPKGVYRTTYTGGYQYPYQAVAADPTLGTPSVPGTTRTSDVVLLKASRVVGTVVYTANLPAAGANVGAWDAGFVNDWTRTAAPGLGANCDGSYAVTGLWPGTYSVTFGPRNEWAPTVVRIVRVGAGATVDLGQTSLPSWIVTGRVVAPAGPVAGVVVDLMVTDPGSGGLIALADSGMPTARAIIPDDMGFFRVFSTRQVGSMQLRVHDPSGACADQLIAVSDPDGWDDGGPFLMVTLTT